MTGIVPPAVHGELSDGQGERLLRHGQPPAASSPWSPLHLRLHQTLLLQPELLPPGERVGGQLDYFQWTTLLREVSALTAYRWVYRESVRPWLVADLLVLNRQMPRSLASCQAMSVSYLERLAADYNRRGPAQRLAGARLNAFNEARIEDIFQSGLHEYIQRFLTENNALADAIHDQYLA